MEEQLRKELIMAAARVLGDNAANRLEMVGKPVKHITTGDIRYYLERYMADRKVEKTTLDNQRRALSAFFNDITVL